MPTSCYIKLSKELSVVIFIYLINGVPYLIKITPLRRFISIFFKLTAIQIDKIEVLKASDLQLHIPGEKYLPRCFIEKVKHPTKVLNVWSVISDKGHGRLYVANGMMNAQQYKAVLETRLGPLLDDWFPDGNSVIMRDGASCYTPNVKKI